MTVRPRVLVTRSRAQASALAGALRARGAETVEVAALTVQHLPLDDRARALLGDSARYADVVFTSANGVAAFVEALHALGRSPDDFGQARVFAAGPATADAARTAGFGEPLVPQTHVAEALADLMLAHRATGPVLFPRAREARDVLPDRLRATGAVVDVIPVYSTTPPAEGAAALRVALDDGVDIVTVASSRTVRHLDGMLTNALRPRLRDVPFASIGPITSATARELGYDVVAEPSHATVDALADVVLAWWNARPGM